MTRPFIQTLLLAVGVVAALVAATVRANDGDQELARRRQECAKLFAEWHCARDPLARADLIGGLRHAAILAERPEVIEEIAADGHLARKELRLPRRARRVPLHALWTFDGIKTTLDREDGYQDQGATPPEGWLVRRITKEAWEVWTPTHGWLFDGRGRVLNEARLTRGGGTGREWYGAFLPNGLWVTTDLEDWDCTLTFFTRDGQCVGQMTSAELAPPGPHDLPRSLLGWARSDKDGAAWIVNVGSEHGYATVRVEPGGPARVLSGIERWRLCHPRALGPRGWALDLEVPDDAGQILLVREETGHGVGVGFPTYGFGEAGCYSLQSFPCGNPLGEGGVSLPDGNNVFGFWPGRQDVFIGTEIAGGDETVDKTWFFDRRWRLQGWTRARRLADAADGRSLLLRADDDSRIVTLQPDLRVAAVRRFVWPDGGTADAVTLFDDLRLGLFVRDGRLVLAGW